MKTIEEEAKEFSNTRGSQSCKLMREVEYDTGRFVGFKAGVKFAQRWIPIEVDNPPVDESIPFIDLKYSITVEVKNGIKIQSAYFNTETGQWISLITGCILNPTHWRQIELK